MIVTTLELTKNILAYLNPTTTVCCYFQHFYHVEQSLKQQASEG